MISSFEKAQHLYASKGITTVQEGMFVEQIKGIYAMLYEQNRLWLDVVAYMDLKNSPELIDAFPSCKGTYDHHLKVGGYKALLDGFSPEQDGMGDKALYRWHEGLSHVLRRRVGTPDGTGCAGTAAAFDACQWGCSRRPVSAGI